jgi:plasmid maintenance system antidote protein VapI
MNERISEEVLRERRVRPPVHPGRVLELEFLEPLEMTAYQLAKAIGVMPPRASMRSRAASVL